MQQLLMQTINKKKLSKYYDKRPKKINDIYNIINKVKKYLKENDRFLKKKIII